jgi:hypothetical protein
MVAGQFIERGIQFARFKGFTNLDLFPTVPPVGILAVENRLLWGRFRFG